MGDIMPVDNKKKEFQYREESVLVGLSGKIGLKNKSCLDQNVSISNRVILSKC